MLKKFLLFFTTLFLFTLNAHSEPTTLTEIPLANGQTFTLTVQDDKTTIELSPISPTGWSPEHSEDKSKFILNLFGIRITSREISAIPVNTDTVTSIKVRQKPELKPVLQIIFTLVNAGDEARVERTREKITVIFTKGFAPPSQTAISEIPPSLPQTDAEPFPLTALSTNGEVLDIMIFWDNGEFRRDTVPVKNGQISYRELGVVDVAGKNHLQIGELLSARLKEYLVNYDVVLMPKDQTRQTRKTVGIAGEVRSESSSRRRTGPGEYIWSEGLSLFNFISSSGGWTNRGDLSNVKLIHRNEGFTQSGRATRVDVQRMRETDDYSNDKKLRTNDLVYIPSRVEASEQKVGVYGFVKIPGMKKIGKGTRITLLRSSGGKIERDLEKIWVTKDRSADVKLKHGDVIYVRPKLAK